MIGTLKARWLSPLLALVTASVAMPTYAQNTGGTWEEAPAANTTEAASESGQAEASASVQGQTQSQAGQPYQDRDPAALTDFSAELEPYGYWRDDPTYGRVWVPHAKVVGPDFAPYVTSGHWALADDGGWIWVSDYQFGWVVFHYGRWVWINGVGWAWIPGRQYAHAWVVWRVADPGWAYVGWAPMPPDYVWVNGAAVTVWFGVYTPWVFCPSAYVYHHHVHHYVVHDHYTVHQVATHSHRYVPPRGAAPYAGPSPKAAHIPAKAVPKKHTPADPKAAAAARQKNGGTAARVVRPGGRPNEGAGTRRVKPVPPPGARSADSSRAPDSTRLRSTRTLSGTSDEPLRSARPPSSASMIPRTSGPSRAGSPPSGPPRTSAPPSGFRSAPSAGAPAPSYAPPPRSRSNASQSSSSSSSSSRAAPPSAPQRSSPPPRTSSPPRMSPAPAPPPRPAPSPSHGGGRRR